MNTVNGALGMSDFLTDTIKFVCDSFRRRSPGTRAERACLEYFAKVLRGCADEVKVERFAFHPAAFNGALKAGGALGVLSAVLSVLAATAGTVRFAGVVSFVFLLITIIIIAGEFVFCRQLFDFAFPRRISKNVYAFRKPSGQADRRIIFAAHADSPSELLLESKPLKKLNMPLLLIFALGILLSFIMSAVYLFSGCPPVKGAWVLYPVILCLFAPFFLFAVIYFRPGKTVEGACSAVSGCAIACAVLKSMDENDLRLRNTEVACLITGGHNSGCRGAAAFVKKHKKQLSDIPTYVIPIGNVSAGGGFTVCSLDRCGTLHNDIDCANLIINAGREAETDVAHADFELRCTDAVPFTVAGISSCTLEAGANSSPAQTKADNKKCISPSVAQSVLDICLACAREYDEAKEATNSDY